MNTDLETPYRLAGEVWDQRIGTARAATTRWQIAFGAMTVIACLAVYGMIDQTRKSTVAPYVVEVEAGPGGRVLRVAPAMERYHPTKAQLQAQARAFIQATRSLPTDPVVARRQWMFAFGIATDKAKHHLGEIGKHSLEDLGKKATTVEITRSIPASEQSYDLTWIESTYDHNGAFLKRTTYSGLVTMILNQPKNEKEVLENPLGVWVDHFSWSAKE